MAASDVRVSLVLGGLPHFPAHINSGNCAKGLTDISKRNINDSVNLIFIILNTNIDIYMFVLGFCLNLYKTLQTMMKKLPRHPQLEMFKVTRSV
jgi:hypothetical protein